MTASDYTAWLYAVVPLLVGTAIAAFQFRKNTGAWWFCCITVCACIAFCATGLNFLFSISFVFYGLITFVVSVLVVYFWFVLMTIKDNQAKVKTADSMPENYYAAITATSMTPAEYKTLILQAEKDAQSILLLPKRLTVMFKSEEMIRDMAKKRYGDGSPYVQAYVSEHTERKAAFFNKLDNGCRVYEIHNRDELVRYLTKHQNHVGIKQVSDNHVIEMLNLWKKAITQYQDRYFVAFTDEPLPLKYELVDDTKFIIHESAGKNSLTRLNAIFVNSPEFGKRVHEDFFSIWERTDPEYKSSEYIISWIEGMIQQLTSTTSQE